MSQLMTTLGRIMEWEPCWEGWTNLLVGLKESGFDIKNEDLPFLVENIIKINGCKDTLWALRSVEDHMKDFFCGMIKVIPYGTKERIEIVKYLIGILKEGKEDNHTMKDLYEVYGEIYGFQPLWFCNLVRILLYVIDVNNYPRGIFLFGNQLPDMYMVEIERELRNFCNLEGGYFDDFLFVVE